MMTASNSTSQQLESEPGVFPIDTMANAIFSVSETVTSPASSEEHHDSTTHHASDRHTRLDSIHLSSDASGETSMASLAADFSTHSFIDSGEGATELRNAHNPPWSHGVTGTPILHRGLTEHTDTLNFLDGPTGEIPSHEETSSPHLSATDSQNLIQDQVLTPRPSVKTAQESLSSLRQISFQPPAAKSTPNRVQPSSSPLYVSSASTHPPSPFDSHHVKRSPTSLRPAIVHLKSPISHVNSLSVRGMVARPQNGTFTAHVSAPTASTNVQPSNVAWREAAGLKTPFQPLDAQASNTRVVSNGSAAGSGASGEVSSEEEEAWPMPQTPFISSENWPQGKAANGKSSVAPVSVAPVDHSVRKIETRETPAVHTPLLPSKLSPSIGSTPHGRIQVSGGGRAPPRGLISHNGAKEGQRRVGRCKMYNCDKGVGFLIDDDLEEVPYDVKIHWTDLYSDQEFKSLAKGEVVEYTLNLTSNGYSASYVTGPGGRPVMGAEFTIVQASRQTSYKLFKAGALPVKTYRSKWEGVPSPAGFLESPETPLGGSGHRAIRSPMTPGTISAAVGGLATPASGVYGLLTKPIKVKLPGTGDVGVASLPQVTSTKPAGTASTPSLVQPSSRPNQSVHHGHVAPTDQILAWNYPSPQTFLPGFNSAYRPLLPALARNNPATPNQPLGQYEAMLLGGYSSQPITSPSSHFSTNGMQPASTIPFNMHALLAERHLLLQQQAALMALYQKSASQSLGLAQAVPLSHGQVSTLLPPISLPTSNTPASDQARTEASSWRSAPTLRPNAQAFSPALESKAANTAQVESVAEEPRTESLVYQPPGRRTVSDPKPTSLLIHKRSLIGAKSTELPAAPRGYKRVTFAEEPARARRVVSYGETDDGEERAAPRVTSVDIAMERLREAGAPRRLSVLSNNHPNLLGEDSAWMIPAN
ncbi:uncharacterized protein MELLADRAFT_91428 [Melampsora larici-populina 98AG31]|uniref:CSD domain-containing protein n=1 Tax=Melampsora larici-populina (strain 98AG31 / pathotype 3-4-7) TaxID=747676 RepID=F4RZ11_MELLP|nr:uncharacterized protein MELLADRAFT_91428 [Melampsora larici-populina 98AG31]EGG02338.1 hypothetical protein MELLADRAFT_91428 [Melampsora larici-populina 98AG31]